METKKKKSSKKTPTATTADTVADYIRARGK